MRYALVFVIGIITSSTYAADDALDAANAARTARGLKLFKRDDGLTAAAKQCADYRAARFMAQHTANDFAFLPVGSHADATGCAAWADGWGSCCTYSDYEYAGAAVTIGRDGLRYMSLFVRGGSGAELAESRPVVVRRGMLRRR